jgi:hypothetical protein
MNSSFLASFSATALPSMGTSSGHTHKSVIDMSDASDTTHEQLQAESAHCTKSSIVGCFAIVSPDEPHKFLSVSDDLCALFDFSSEQMCGRSIKILQGPSTNAALLCAAIKLASFHHKSTLPLTAYCSNGSERILMVSCAPHFSHGSKVKAVELTFVRACQSTRSYIRSAEQNSMPSGEYLDEPSAHPNMDHGTKKNLLHLPPNDLVLSARRCATEGSSRRLHNFAIGLELQAERNETLTCQVDNSSAKNEDLLFDALLASA